MVGGVLVEKDLETVKKDLDAQIINVYLKLTSKKIEFKIKIFKVIVKLFLNDENL